MPAAISPFALAAFGELIADASRAAMLLSLMDGRSRPASELAAIAGIGKAAGSEHLARLRSAGVLSVHQQGRHRFYRLASEEAASAIEALGALQRPRALSPERRALAAARTCYGHLAGTLGVALQRTLEARDALGLREGAVAVTPRGEVLLTRLGLKAAHWPPGKLCLDWTERQNHLGGPLGVQLARGLFEQRLVVRAKEGRAVRVTDRGRRALHEVLGLRLVRG